MDAWQKSLTEQQCFSMKVLEKAKEKWGLESFCEQGHAALCSNQGAFLVVRTLHPVPVDLRVYS